MDDRRSDLVLKSLPQGVLETFSSVKFAVGLVAVIGAACIAGTLGFPNLFYTWWFVGLLGLLAGTVAVCSTRRILTVRRTTGFARRRAIGSMLTHISILLVLAGGMVRGILGEKGFIELREGETKSEFQIGNRAKPLPFALGLADFSVERYADRGSTASAEEDAVHHLALRWAERGLTARLPVQLKVRQTLVPQGEPSTENNTYHITVLEYVPDFVMDAKSHAVTSRSSEPNNPAILVDVQGPSYQNNCWLFAKFPGFVSFAAGHEPDIKSPLEMVYEVEAAAPASSGTIKSFKSAVRIQEKNSAARVEHVEVNRPLRVAGYTLFQTGYNPEDLSWTSLQVVRDPGVPLVYAGFCFPLAGLFTVFYLNPWLEARRNTALPK